MTKIRILIRIRYRLSLMKERSPACLNAALTAQFVFVISGVSACE